jgi:hypothetical protein
MFDNVQTPLFYQLRVWVLLGTAERGFAWRLMASKEPPEFFHEEVSSHEHNH